jgi:two-component system response regulator MtrA
VHKILLVEDDAPVREMASLVLEREGFEVTSVGTGTEGLELARSGSFDLLLLDLMLPGLSGLEVCRQLRERSTLPIVMLTARADSGDVVAGLDLGADDYVTKPFDPAVLGARIRAVLRRLSVDEPVPLAERDLLVDEVAFRAYQRGVELVLTRIELLLLAALVRGAGQVMTREGLLEQVWGYDYLGDSRLVDMAVTRLRRKLGEPALPPPYISTIRGVGYRFERDADAP